MFFNAQWAEKKGITRHISTTLQEFHQMFTSKMSYLIFAKLIENQVCERKYSLLG